jgi:hypothetical protein
MHDNCQGGLCVSHLQGTRCAQETTRFNIRLTVGPEDHAWWQRLRSSWRNVGGMAVCLRLVALWFGSHVRESCSRILCCSSRVLQCCAFSSRWALEGEKEGEVISRSTACRRRRHLLGLGEVSRCILPSLRILRFVSLARKWDVSFVQARCPTLLLTGEREWRVVSFWLQAIKLKRAKSLSCRCLPHHQQHFLHSLTSTQIHHCCGAGETGQDSLRIQYMYLVTAYSSPSCTALPCASDNPGLNSNVDNSSRWWRGPRGAGAAAQDEIGARR